MMMHRVESSPAADSAEAGLAQSKATQVRAVSQGVGHLFTQILILAVFTLLITLACRYVLDTVFELNLLAEFWHRDYLGNLLIALLAYALVQSRNRALVLTSVIVIGFQMANGGKLSVLGTPVSPDDFMNVQNLFYLTEGWRRIALMLLAALPLITAVLLIPFRRKSAWVLLAMLSGTLVLVNQYSEPLRVYLDARFGNSVWNQPENFKRRGLALHVTQESVRTLAKIGKHPDRAAVLAATQSLTGQLPTLKGEFNIATASRPAPHEEQRNVHIIVLESFFDPMTLGPDWVPEDPFPASFRELWAQSGNTHALSPVFGGYTANAEFETLCGFPVTENAVFFEGWLRRKVPCLPAMLAERGYRTIASHPNVAGFWNRTHAYNLVGFERYLSKEYFNLDDSVQGLLLDHSFYDQVFARISQPDDHAPVLNYMLTYHGHLPYPSNEQYPDRIKAGQDAPLLHGYLNQLWYKSRDLMARVELLRAQDPDSLIVLFGDHLPFLGPNYGVYTEAKNLPADRADFTGAMLEYLVSTPLIVIDGDRGPLTLGKLPLYRLPALILELLGDQDGAGMLNWTVNPVGEVIRPIYGMHVSVQGDSAIACPDETVVAANCAASASWLARTRLLINDLFTGKQYSLSKLTQPATLSGS
ncbi:MAG: LTA synthase family protein [Granulosicoccus sp.]|nr:LTA synthase family protein [Granulosicoccus sp.]